MAVFFLFSQSGWSGEWPSSPGGKSVLWCSGRLIWTVRSSGFYLPVWSGNHGHWSRQNFMKLIPEFLVFSLVHFLCAQNFTKRKERRIGIDIPRYNGLSSHYPSPKYMNISGYATDKDHSMQKWPSLFSQKSPCLIHHFELEWSAWVWSSLGCPIQWKSSICSSKYPNENGFGL